MCGITGFVSTRPLLDESALSRMNDALRHRGPDDAGLKLWDVEGRDVAAGPAVIGLAHRRLSIIDLSADGHQPMANEDGRVWTAFNGELYNFQELRQALLDKHWFASRTDTEVLIHLYEEKGIEGALSAVNGMFAFAIWDTSSRSLFLARDRVGKKPLYYLQTPDGSLVFASEIGALLQSGLVDRGRIDSAALVQFWSHGYVSGERTIYQQIRRLLPGHYAVWHDGELTIREYWDCPFGLAPATDRSLDDLADELEALLLDAIRLRLVADVPVGLFLSGGVDSSLIAALTARLTGGSMETFSIGFAHSSFNEAGYAETVARHLKLSHHVLTVTDSLEDHFDTVVDHFGEPFGDSSAIPTYFVCKLARRHVTVALTGDGGDELFAGYDAYAKALMFWGTRAQRRLFAPRWTLLQKIVECRHWGYRGDRRLNAIEMILPPAELPRILSERVWRAVEGQSPYAERERWYQRARKADLLSQLQYSDLKSYLPEDILVKVDRMSMAHALECRCPLLDYRVVEFAARLPYTAKISATGEQKVILRHLLARHVPRALTDRPKMGFCVPWAQWCQGPLGDRLRRRWKEQRNGFHRPEAARRLFPRHKIGWAARQWNAYASLRFFDGRPLA
jgi:asparagine synthase (glutamine-hydrolysing)